jgi:hypothetical protein
MYLTEQEMIMVFLIDVTQIVKLNSWNPYVPYRTRNDNGIFNRRNSNSQTERNSKPLKVNLGFTFSPNKPSSVGLYGTIGRETFIYLSYEGSSKSEYEHYYNIIVLSLSVLVVKYLIHYPILQV